MICANEALYHRNLTTNRSLQAAMDMVDEVRWPGLFKKCAIGCGEFTLVDLALGNKTKNNTQHTSNAQVFSELNEKKKQRRIEYPLTPNCRGLNFLPPNVRGLKSAHYLNISSQNCLPGHFLDIL